MRANKLIRGCGPYEVHGFSQDRRGVRLEIYPAFPEYNLPEKERANNETAYGEEWVKEPRWAMHRYNGDGGGPGIFTCMALATAFEQFLNQFYTSKQVEIWKSTNALALKEANKRHKNAKHKEDQ